MLPPRSLYALPSMKPVQGENGRLQKDFWVGLTVIGSFACLLSIKHQHQRDSDE
jgi:hypothetical protein